MSLITISKLVSTIIRKLKKTYDYILDKFIKIKLEEIRKYLNNSKIIAFSKIKNKQKSMS